MPICNKSQQAAAVVVDISVVDRRFQNLIQNSIQNEQPINLMCSGNEIAMAIDEVETVVIHRLDSDVLVHDLRL